jgi:ABC-2 type transport system ATP-binding protein
MRRRLAVVRALLHEPPLLILDEPTLGVDVEARHQIWTHLRGIRAQRRTVLLTTNYMDEAEALCDRVVVLNRGRVVADDAPENLLSRAGRCIELECSPESAITLQEMFGEDPEVLRSELTESGLRLFVRRASLPEPLVRRAMERTPVSGFRVRSPDLAEVFRVLPAGPA